MKFYPALQQIPFALFFLALTSDLLAQSDPPGQNSGPEASKEARASGPSGKLNFQTDLFTGRFSYEVPIEAAPARNGSEPKLTLRYNSATENGWCGHSWELDLGFIQRETKRGVPVKWGTLYPLREYNDDQGFQFSLDGQASGLVRTGTNEFRAEIEAAFLRFNLVTNVGGASTNYWLVTDKSGNRYFFGQTANSRMANTKSGWPSNEARGTFRWALSRIETVRGDTTSISYTNIAGALYPLLVAYNGHASGLSNSHTIEFQLGDRQDRRLAYNPGFRVETSKRLTNVLIKVGGRLARRYQISYMTSPSTLRSLIDAVTVFGTNNTTSLPPYSFDYSVQSFQFQVAVAWTNLFLPAGSGAAYNFPFNSSAAGLFADIVDVNGDGLPDRVTASTNSTAPFTNFLVQANTGAGFGPVALWGPFYSQAKSNSAPWCVINSGYTRFLDLNGDGHPDRVMDPREAYDTHPPLALVYTNLVAELNTGVGFTADTEWTNVVPSATGASSPLPSYLAIENPSFVTMLDMNGDGLPDRLMRGWQSPGTTPYTNYIVQFNTGHGFGQTNYFGPYYSQNQWTNQGSSFSDLDSEYVRLLDINGDDLPDRVMMPLNPVTGGTYQNQLFTNYVVEFNNGHGFEPGQNWGGIDPQYNQPPTANCAGGTTSRYCEVQDFDVVALRDINGDGLPDRLMRQHCYPYTNWMVQINVGNGFAPVGNFGPYFSQGQTSSTEWSAINSLVTTLLDINGDGLPDRVMAKYQATGNPATDNYFVVELSKGPMPDLLTVISNGIGGAVSAAYKPATQYDNRESTNSPNARRLLPFPIYTVASVAVSDGLYPSNTTTYAYEGGMWSSARREFHGFCCVKVKDPLGLSTAHWFHQAGGRDNSGIGEFADTTNNIGKKGFPFRVETLGTNGQFYNLTLNKVEDADLGSDRHFPFVGQTLKLDYPGHTGGYRATAVQYGYDLGNGNLIQTTNYGEVTASSPASHTFTDIGGDAVYQFSAYATLANTSILDKPERAIVTADAAGQEILREMLYDYDGATGNLTRQRERICPGSYRTSTFGYDAFGNHVAETNAAGIATLLTYDSAYQTFPEQQTTAGSFVTLSSFSPLSGSLLSSTDPKGLVTSNAYDALLRLTNTWISTNVNGPANLWVARYSYGLGGIVSGASRNSLRVRRNDDLDTVNGHETWTYYDGLGRVLQVRIEAETNGFRVSDTVYDQRGNIRLETQSYFNTGTNYSLPTGTKDGTARYYDPNARLTNATPCVDATFTAGGLLQTIVPTVGDTGSPVGPVVTVYEEGNEPWIIIRTDEEGKVRKYFLDAFGRTNKIIEVTGGGNYITALRYDKTGLLTNITDHAGNAIEYTHNDLGEVIAIADPNLGVWEYRRDVAGRVREQIDAKTNSVRFDYTDPLGRLKAKLVYSPLGAFVYGVTNEYDSSDDPAFTVFPGQLYRVLDAEGWEKNSYDVRGRTLKTARFLSKNGQTYTNQFAYDEADRLCVTIYPNGGPTLTNIYDLGGNLCQVRQVGGSNTLFYDARGFNALGQLLGVNFGNGVVTTNDYFACTKRLRRLVTFKSGSTNIQDLTYTYDKVSNVKSITDAVYSGSAVATLTGIQYDDLHRLTSLTHLTQGTKTYSYSAIGNVLNNGELGADTYNYGVRMPHAVKRVGSRSYAYDANGNMIVRNGQRLDYDGENRLSRLWTASITNAFGYAEDGARLWKVGPNGLQVWIGTLYEEKQGKVLFHVMAEGHKVCTFDTTGTNVFEYYHSDHLRSTSILTDRNGNRIQHHEYSAFGRDRFTESLTTFPLSHRFTGQVLDEDTGLYYYNARYYDPELGRFIQPDTLIPHLDEPQSYNRYSYVLNNPLKYRDPTGNIEELDGVIVHKSGYVGSGVRTVRGPLGSISVAGLNPAELAAVNFQIAVGKGDALMQKVYAEQLRPYLAHASYEMILAGAYNPQATGNALMAMLPVAPAASPVLPRAAGQTATGHYGTPARASLPGSGQIDALAGRLAEIHGALDPIAARHRTTALLSTSGGNIIGGGGRDLTPAQRALVKPAEILAKQPGAHAEITVLGEATRRGLRPRAIVTSREICPSCQQELIDPRTSG